MLSRIAVVLASALLCLLALVVPAYAAFPGENGKIAFVGNQDGSPQLYTMDPDGSGVVQLTHGPGDNVAAAWSADGQKIAFSSTRDNANPATCDPCNFEIYVMNADGTNQVRLTDSAEPDFQPAWSPDGAKIAWGHVGNCAPSCTNDIYVMNADGSNQANIDPGPANDAAPSWSPNGQKIAFSRFGGNEAGPDSEVYSMNADGTGQVNLTNDPGFWESAPEWSPDAQRIAYTREQCGNDCFDQDQYFGVSVMNADGSTQTSLTFDGLGPAWSPDGSKIAFSVHTQCMGFLCLSADVYTMSPDGSGQTALTSNLRGVYSTPDNWQPIQAPPGPQRSDYKNAAQFCKAERDFLGDEAFTKKYRTNGNGANAHGKCVSAN